MRKDITLETFKVGLLLAYGKSQRLIVPTLVGYEKKTQTVVPQNGLQISLHGHAISMQAITGTTTRKEQIRKIKNV
jgi:hypothetical protein